MAGRLRCVVETMAKPHVAASIAVLVMLTLPFSMTGSPRVSSITIVLLILGYAIASVIYPLARWAFLIAALVSHVVSIAIYYTNPLVLPFVVLEREGGRYSINIDLIQLILVYELRNALVAQPGVLCKQDKEDVEGMKAIEKGEEGVATGPPNRESRAE
ncbi:MAG: hypothetical protein F7C07_01605 [Desulfurococcales archaeon]|nr:hypothetical protein [Desulfurococcales archaeon]